MATNTEAENEQAVEEMTELEKEGWMDILGNGKLLKKVFCAIWLRVPCIVSLS